MKKLIAAGALALMALGLGAGAVQADPSVTLCHDIEIVVNGEALLDDAACQTQP